MRKTILTAAAALLIPGLAAAQTLTATLGPSSSPVSSYARIASAAECVTG